MDEICLKIGVDSRSYKEEDNQSAYNDADNFEPLEPVLVVPTDRLEHAPETVVQMEPESNEPDNVEEEHPDVAEGLVEEGIGVVDGFFTHELLKLHLSPEMGEMEGEKSKNNDTENEHVLCRPGISLCLAGYLISLDTASFLVVFYREVNTIADMDKEAEGEDRDHDVDNRSGHEIAPELVESVACREEFVVEGGNSVFAIECVDDREEVNYAMKNKEEDKESSTYALDELLSDRRCEKIRHYNNYLLVSDLFQVCKYNSFLSTIIIFPLLKK